MVSWEENIGGCLRIFCFERDLKGCRCDLLGGIFGDKFLRLML